MCRTINITHRGQRSLSKVRQQTTRKAGLTGNALLELVRKDTLDLCHALFCTRINDHPPLLPILRHLRQLLPQPTLLLLPLWVELHLHNLPPRHPECIDTKDLPLLRLCRLCRGEEG